ncbi:GNAT family N-acetyltransferase [Thalassovita mangrovi]|uniref:GNAT family N-acetyltransferase n=1 Tax=Thalassovita mangrovi TaxID=2692236 RepID=A0A6L8LRM7_9RHOB|nr:GNAT family N-acetyltransferase [Thalassovita mangrovi]MYM56122.1 GNAT family N-acetyltransferase [Thalassovita mangrovi]
MIDIQRWTAPDLQNGADALARILHGCVHDGASVGFILPHPLGEALEFWRSDILDQVRQGHRLLLVAQDDGVVVGTVSLVTASPANQPHRAEISKLLVHPDHRRKGIAKRLMRAAEQAAVDAGKSLLTLDTRSGDSAEPLYASLGFETAGVIPGYCLDVTGQRFDSTTYMYKHLTPVPA